MGKSRTLPFKKSSSRAANILDLIHTDVWGPSPVQSGNCYRFYIHFVDDHSRFTWIYPLKFKSDALIAFTHFKSLVENKFERKIKCVHSDFDGEFTAFTNFLQTHGIEFQRSCPHTCEQNGRAERKHRHITEMGLTLLSQAGMPRKYWVEAFETSVYLINSLPTPVLAGKSPYKILFNTIPDYKLLKTFGSACFPCLHPYQQHKFQFHTTKCVNLGYSEVVKGYKCLSSTGRIYISRNVVFNEAEFQFLQGFLNTRQAETRFTVDSSTWFSLPASSSNSPAVSLDSPDINLDSPSSRDLSPNVNVVTPLALTRLVITLKLLIRQHRF
jgi:histone deacetylase 1/2